jgi:DNA-directed RNA polymerase subunit M/transcription elongation factor TFIIS
MEEAISQTIAKNYPDLIGCFTQIQQIKWDRVYKKKTPAATKRRKKASAAKKLSANEKRFLMIQKTLVVLGTYINVNGGKGTVEEILHVKIDAKNYDELVTNINWSNKEQCLIFWYELDKLCEAIFPDLYEEGGEWTIRKNNRRLIHEMLLECISDKQQSVNPEQIQNIAHDIERSIMLYTLLMVTEVCQGDLQSIDWKDDFLKRVYLSKSNCVLSSLTNEQYNLKLIKKILSENMHPIELATMKRSQLLSKRFKDLETSKMKIYEESGISQGDEDFTVYHSTIKCPKCKLYHTTFKQLQTRGADEPMTIFWYCHKCKIRGRQ